MVSVRLGFVLLIQHVVFSVVYAKLLYENNASDDVVVDDAVEDSCCRCCLLSSTMMERFFVIVEDPARVSLRARGVNFGFLKVWR